MFLPRLLIPLLLVAPTDSWAQAPLGENASDGWTIVEEVPSEALALDKVQERGGGTLEIQGASVVRRRGNDRLELGCMLDGGPGELRALAQDPAGLTFVAAEHGLFVVSPEVEVLDPIELWDGAPSGSPSSVFVDADRRVWVATEREFGCLDPSFYYGSSIPVPHPGPYRILAWDRDSIALSTGSGTLRYDIDHGSFPRVAGVSREGHALSPEQALGITFGDSIPLVPTGTGNGTLTFRYRIDQHHKWLPLGDAIDSEIEPGEHTLDVVAVDRDLRLSEPFPLRVLVDYPFYYRKEFVAGSLLLVTLLIFSFFTWLGRRGSRRHSMGRAVISTGLVVVFGLQILAGIVPHGRGWPFIGYSMYTTSFEEEHLTYNGVLAGFSAQDELRMIPTGAIGGASDNRWQVLGPLIRGDAALSTAALAKYNAKRPKWVPIVRLQVWAERTRLTAEGAIPIAPLILSDQRAIDPATTQDLPGAQGR